MKSQVIGIVGAMALSASVNADSFEMGPNLLRDGTVSNKQNCVTIRSGFTVKASTSKGRVTTYKTNNPSHGHGIYIGAPSSPPYTSANTTAPSEGIYSLSFEPAVTSIALTMDWLTNDQQPAEAIWAFATDHGPATISYQPVGNTSAFDGGGIVATSGRGAGVLTYSGKPFKTFKFKHRQHPRNIGFTIKNIQATVVPARCR